MSALPWPNDPKLQPIENPYPEPRIAYQATEPRKVNNLTLIDGKTFLSASVAGDIAPPGAPDVGYFHQDTRFLSQLELKVSGHRAVVLSSSTEKNMASQVELTMGNVTIRDSLDLPENTVHIRREQLLYKDVFFDNFSFENFNLQDIEFDAELTYAADFVDVFQVRGCARGKSGQHYRPIADESSITFQYRGLDDQFRTTSVNLEPTPNSHGVFDDHVVARWHVKLEPFGVFSIKTVILAHIESETASIESAKDFPYVLKLRRTKFAEWEEHSTAFLSSNDEFNSMLRTASGDFHALRIPDGNERVVAAGIPWFATIFGRDSLIASYQTLALNPTIAADTARVLARRQGVQTDDWRDENPGKILHEQRDGEMANTAEIPFGEYYGSVDATPLFLVLVSEIYNWTADERLIHDLLPNIYKAIEWIDKFGDLDGDGLIEYQRRSAGGLANQGWKDSWDANMHADGEVAKSPIALVEVQGYVYDAKYRMSRLLRRMGDFGTADRLKQEAAEMARRIEKHYWMPKHGFYAMALDKEKRQLEVVSSNPGHLLFSRALKADRARAVISRFMQDDLHSGWGWRTMAKSERVFNPLSYHRGSVWPHDNSLIAHGMALYNEPEAALHTLTTLFQAALAFRDVRLPELFCGIQRNGESDVPVKYPVSCSPQAWASGAVFMMLTSVLGIRPSAAGNELTIMNPMLPEWLTFLKVRHMRVGNSRVDLDFERRGTRTFCNVVRIDGDKLLVNVAFRK